MAKVKLMVELDDFCSHAIQQKFLESSQWELSRPFPPLIRLRCHNQEMESSLDLEGLEGEKDLFSLHLDTILW